MRLRAVLLATILLSLAAVLTGCEMLTTPEPWIRSPRPTPSPTAMLMWPTPTPSGLMPSVLGEIDLGLPAGDAYGPAALALGEDSLAYVLCQHVENAQEGQAGVSVVDLESGQVRDVWRLPGQSTGPLAAGGNRLYVHYRTAFDALLRVLDASDGTLVKEVSIEPIALRSGLWIDAQRGRLFLALADGIEMRDALSLQPLARLPYPVSAADRQVVLDVPRDRLYLGLSATLVAYRASELTKLWEVQMPAQTIERMILDVRADRLVVQARAEREPSPRSELLSYDLEGDLLMRISPQLDDQPWELLWADEQADHLVVSSTSYAARRPARLSLWTLDLEGQVMAGPSVHWGGTPATVAGRDDLFLLDGAGQRLLRLGAASLEPLASVPLGVKIADLAFDSASGRLLASEAAGALHELDVHDLEGGTLRQTSVKAAGAGPIAWLPDLEILIVGARDGDHDQVSVLEPASLDTIQVITGGDQIAVDTRRNRVIVGSYTNPGGTETGQLVIWDLARREWVGAIAPGGAPAYNPLRDEIYVVGRGVSMYDASTLERVGSLTPDIEAQACVGCAGQPTVSAVHIYPEQGIVWLEMDRIGAGWGGGLPPAARLFALDTLAPLSLTVTALPTWDDGPILWPPVGQRVYQNVASSRDVQRANLIIRDARGVRRDWRGGLQLAWLSPAGRLVYAAWGDRWLALDAVTWQPVGTTPRLAVHSYLPEQDVLLAAQDSALLAVAPRWGDSLPMQPPEDAAPAGAIQALAVSPNYTSDPICFAIGGGTLYRSGDGGASCQRLAAGLPEASVSASRHLVMALSPTFGADRTLVVGGWEGGQGLGLWGSRDAGDTWEPLWLGLEHLRVEAIAFSPAFARNRTMWASCRWDDLLASTSGRSLFRSVDAGQTWELFAKLDDESEDVSAAWPTTGTSSPVRAIRGGRAVEIGEGDQVRITLSLPVGELIVEQAQADDVLYLLTSLSLYRSTDGGEHWELATGAAFEGRRPGQSFTALAVWGEGRRQRVFLGDRVGQVQVLVTSRVRWRAVN